MKLTNTMTSKEFCFVSIKANVLKNLFSVSMSQSPIFLVHTQYLAIDLLSNNRLHKQ